MLEDLCMMYAMEKASSAPATLTVLLYHDSRIKIFLFFLIKEWFEKFVEDFRSCFDCFLSCEFSHALGIIHLQEPA